MRFKKAIAVTLLTTTLSGFVCPAVIKAETVDKKIENAQKKIDDLTSKKNESDKSLEELNATISKIDSDIDKILSEKALLEKEINELTKEIDELKVIIEKRNKQIENQARSAQINQEDQDLMNIVLDSESISDALSRTVAYTKLVSANKDVMEAQKKDQVALDKKKATLSKKVDEVNKTAEELKTKQETLEQNKATQVALAEMILKELSKESGNKSALQSQKEEAERIAEENKKRLKELSEKKEAAKKELEEQRKKEQKEAEDKQLEAQDSISPSKPSSAIGQSNNNQSDEKPNEVVSLPSQGGFALPLAGGYTVTSRFGSRPDPTGYSGSHHDGIDLAIGAGTPILASRAGEVVEASYHPSAGNHVIILHDNGLFTYYMHMTNIRTSVGSVVQAGETIGTVGSTGNSTGAHLHFGISSGLWSGFIDPSSILSF
ncbi:murein hydrolase activator EnvC family protein [Vagococcus teuberi]